MTFTEKEFDELRDEISNIFSNKLGEYFNFKRSTYKWSSEHDFTIIIEVKSNWKKFKELKPEEEIKLIIEMLESVKNFINSEEKNFTFVNMHSGPGISFNFIFQPTSERVKKLLTKQ